MVRTQRNSSWLVAWMLIAAWACVAHPAQAQEKAAAPAPAATKAASAKARGRLPAHFASVITPEQREEIYGIQARFNERIEQLEAELESLRQQRDKEVDGVLSAEQMERVTQLREEARQRRSTRSSSKSTAGSEDAGAN